MGTRLTVYGGQSIAIYSVIYYSIYYHQEARVPTSFALRPHTTVLFVSTNTFLQVSQSVSECGRILLCRMFQCKIILTKQNNKMNKINGQEQNDLFITLVAHCTATVFTHSILLQFNLTHEYVLYGMLYTKFIV